VLRLVSLNQQFIQLIGERLFVPITKRTWTAGFNAGGAQLVRQIASLQSRSDVVFRVEYAAWIDGHSPCLDDQPGQWNISGHDNVPGSHILRNMFIRNVGASTDHDTVDVLRRRRVQGHVRYERDLDLTASGCSKQEMLDLTGTSIRINPDFHSVPSDQCEIIAPAIAAFPSESVFQQVRPQNNFRSGVTGITGFHPRNFYSVILIAALSRDKDSQQHKRPCYPSDGGTRRFSSLDAVRA